MKVKIDASNKWITAQGEEIPMVVMPNSHLLAAIHMMERNRLQKLQELEKRINEAKAGNLDLSHTDITTGFLGDDLNIEFTHEEVLEQIEEQYKELRECYSRYPKRYYDMVGEALHRNIICRGPSEVNRLVEVQEKIVEKIRYRTRPGGSKEKKNGGKGKSKRAHS